MILEIPQIIWIVLTMLGLGIYLAKHGKKKEDNYNFWSALLGVILNCILLYYGGFFG